MKSPDNNSWMRIGALLMLAIVLAFSFFQPAKAAEPAATFANLKDAMPLPSDTQMELRGVQSMVKDYSFWVRAITLDNKKSAISRLRDKITRDCETWQRAIVGNRNDFNEPDEVQSARVGVKYVRAKLLPYLTKLEKSQ